MIMSDEIFNLTSIQMMNESIYKTMNKNKNKNKNREKRNIESMYT